MAIFSVCSVEEPKRRQNQFAGVGVRALEGETEDEGTERGKELEMRVSAEREVKGK